MVIPSLAKESWNRICEAYEIPPDAEVVPLQGDVNRLFHITSSNGASQVLRLSPPDTDSKWIASELMVLQYISQNTELRVPSPIPDKHGRLSATIYESDQSPPTQIVMFTFMSGENLSRQELRPDMMFLIGRTLGRLDLTLKCADKALRPSPSRIRGKRDGQQIINWALAPFGQPSADSDFPQNKRCGGFSHKEIADISRRLRINYKKLNAFLPKQLLHLDAHLENLVFDGTTIGIMDFNNMACGPRIYELAAPLHTIYEKNASRSLSIRSGWFAELVEALTAGYCSEIPLSRMELKGFCLIQALRLFSGLGWAFSRQENSEWNYRLVQYGASTARQISMLLDEFENSVSFSNLHTLRSWTDRAAQLFRSFLPLNKYNFFLL